MRRNKELYNYLVNTLGISKEIVLEHARARLDDLINKHIASRLESKYIEKLILNRVTQVVKEGVSIGSYSRSAFDDYLKSLIRDAIREKVNGEYSLDVKIVQRDASIISKVPR